VAHALLRAVSRLVSIPVQESNTGQASTRVSTRHAKCVRHTVIPPTQSPHSVELDCPISQHFPLSLVMPTADTCVSWAHKSPVTLSKGRITTGRGIHGHPLSSSQRWVRSAPGSTGKNSYFGMCAASLLFSSQMYSSSSVSGCRTAPSVIVQGFVYAPKSSIVICTSMCPKSLRV